MEPGFLSDSIAFQSYFNGTAYEILQAFSKILHTFKVLSNSPIELNARAFLNYSQTCHRSDSAPLCDVLVLYLYKIYRKNTCGLIYDIKDFQVTLNWRMFKIHMGKQNFWHINICGLL